MKRILLIVIALMAMFQAEAQSSAIVESTAYDFVESKNYYFVSQLEKCKDVDSLLRGSKKLMAIAQSKLSNLSKAGSMTEYVDAFKFSEKEIKEIGTELSSLYDENNAIGRLLSQDIVPSGCYALCKQSGAALLKAIWEQDARGMNYAIDVYAAARRPNYPAIDSISFNIDSREYVQELLPTCKQNVERWAESHPMFYSVPLRAVDMLLDMNNRLQAADYEPLSETVNKASYQQVASTDWAAYPYSAIVVLGAGPETRDLAISPSGRMRTAYGAMLYNDRQAPFIIVSGGKVHPANTPYNEAVEMKKYLMEVWNVPESAIIVEPHARHTTTNMRNASRIMLSTGFPADKKAIVTSSVSHIDYVVNDMAARCIKELGYVPYTVGERVNSRVLEFSASPLAHTINPLEPLDP